MFDLLDKVDPELARLARKFVTETSEFLSENRDNDAMGWPRKSPELCLPAGSTAACRSEPAPLVACAPEEAVGFVVGDGTADVHPGAVAPVLMFVVPAHPLPPDLYVHWVLQEGGAKKWEEDTDAWIWVPEVQLACAPNPANGHGARYPLLAGHGIVAVPAAKVRMAV